MRIRLVVPDGDVAPGLIEPALETVTQTNVRHMMAGMPDIRDAIAAGRVKWKPEPPGDEHFDLARTVMRRGWGDCDDLAPAHAAALRFTGEDPGAKAIIRKSGQNRWHAIVQRSDGSIDDPSRDAGMGKGRVSGAHVPLTRSVACLGLSGRRWKNGYCARTELPLLDGGLAVHVVGVGPGPAIEAAHGAAQLAAVLGERDANIEYRALRDILAGVDPEAVSERYSVDGWGIFKKLTQPFRAALAPIQSAVQKGVASAARGIVNPLSSALGPVTMSLLKAADPLGLSKYAGSALEKLAPLAALAPIPGAAAFGPLVAQWSAAALKSGDPFGAVPISAIESGEIANAIMKTYAPGAASALQGRYR